MTPIAVVTSATATNGPSKLDGRNRIERLSFAWPEFGPYRMGIVQAAI